MHTKSIAERSIAAAALETYFDTPANYAHTNNVADLVLEPLPSGEHAWLRPSTEGAEVDDARYTITDAGRRALREADCFGPWPTVAQETGT